MGGRWVEVPPERFSRWVANFAARHGATAAQAGAETVLLRAEDGAQALCHPPFPPLPARVATVDDVDDAAASPEVEAALVAAHAGAARTVGVILVRLGGYAAGVFEGAPPRLAASKTGSRLVHGRSAAGGWSQHRFARRRENQATAALSAAADTATAVLGPYSARLDAVVFGGDRRAVAGLRSDPRLEKFAGLVTERFLTVPDPRLAVLQETPKLFRAIRIYLTGPP